jgi:hypothetical protein
MKHVHLPIDIWNLTQFQPTQRVLLAVVQSYTLAGRRCFMSNAGMSDLLHVDARTVRRWISELVREGHLIADYDTGRRYLSRGGHACPGGWTPMSGGGGHGRPGGVDTDVHHTIKETVNHTNKQTELTDMKERPTIEDVTDYLMTTQRAKESRLTRGEVKRIAVDAVDHYDANDWTTRTGDRISSWKAAMSAWMRRALKDYTPKPVHTRPKKDPEQLRRDIAWHTRRLTNYREAGKRELAAQEASWIKGLRRQLEQLEG